MIVQLRVLEGEGAIYPIGSRATKGLTVEVTDETGQPVDGATVSFRLPDQGPSGIFNGGIRTQIVTTQAGGKASVWGMQWNKIPGPFEIRVTAVKDQARAGIVTKAILSDASALPGGTGTFRASHRGRKWLLIAAVAAGAGAGMAMALGHAASAVPAVAPSVAPQIGQPTLTVGHP